MTVEAVETSKKNVLVGIRMDSRSRELLNWAIVKVAEPGDRVVAVHVSQDPSLRDKLLLEGYLEVHERLCDVKQVDLTGQLLTGSSIKRVLVREAKKCVAAAVVLGINWKNAIGGWSSMAKYCAKKLPSTTEVLAIHNGKVVFRRFSNDQPPGDPRPSFFLSGNPPLRETQSEFAESEASDIERASSTAQSYEEGSNRSYEHKKVSRRSNYFFDPSEQRPGWPLLGKTNSVIQHAPNARKMSVVQWVMSLPDRSPETPQCPNNAQSPSSGKISEFTYKSNENWSSSWAELPKELEVLLKTNSSDCRWFIYEVLQASTSQFSSENLIGKGGSNRVYKGILPNGKPVAVKVLKSSKEAWGDFAMEVDIMSSLKHKNIAPLLGICLEDNHLISVYEFLSRGSLEENLHGNIKDKSALSWEVRFNLAIGIAEALNYLHNECSRPVIHRDVKSSNILLSSDFEPQLSDFGLAIWGPTTSSFLTHGDVVGTFGYLAPEYFMYGKVSDKIDVYSFGVVLLELLSGRRPIGSESPKGQESLVMWAKPRLESGDPRGIMDPDLDGKFNEVQVQRMVLAATLCISQAARRRPKINQILKLLTGEKDVDWVNSQIDDKNDLTDENENDDEVYPDSSAESHLGLALLDVDDNFTSFSSMEQGSRLSLEEYLKGRWSRSSSLD